MSNMNYCRFQNTLNDLRDCEEALSFENMADWSQDEQKAAQRLIKLCARIKDEYYEESDE